MLVDVHHDRRGRIHTRIALSNNRVQGIGAIGSPAQTLLMTRN
jgi:hypothetical protein